nr:sugar phosphate nucleotidyltransferase [Lebetimonas sp. JH292]
MKNIILCGGSGTRLWPLSRKLMPKQFIKLFDNKSLFQLTAKRTLDQLEEINKLALAAFQSNEDEILFITPSDHLKKNEKKI